MIVVDVGCMPHGPEESVHKLIDRFQPELLFGFDPHPGLVEGVERIGDTVVVRRNIAAWTCDCVAPVKVDGICTGISGPLDTSADDLEVDCVSLPSFLRALPGRDVVLKLDAEGAEYPLLSLLATEDLDEWLALVLVEWHPVETAHGWFMEERPTLRCPVEEWV